MRYIFASFLIAAAVLSYSCRPLLTVYTVKAAGPPLPDTTLSVLLGMDDTARIAGTYIGDIVYESPFELDPPFRTPAIDILKTAARSKGANLVKVTGYIPADRGVRCSVYAAIYKVADARHYEPSIQWTGRRELDFSDFKGPASLGGDSVRSMGSYEFYLIPSMSYTEKKAAYETRVEFYGNASWIDKGAPDSGELLIHEQSNFDLCEIYRLQLQKRLRDHRDGDISPEDVYLQIHTAYLATRAKYESETAHGLNYPAQAEWTRKITAVSSAFEVGRLLTRSQLEKKAKLLSRANHSTYQREVDLPVLPDPFWGP